MEKERQIREAKKKAEEDWKSRLIVNNPYFYTSLCMDRNSQLDKIKVEFLIEFVLNSCEGHQNGRRSQERNCVERH